MNLISRELSFVSSHPIVLECIKTYDIVLSFKSLIEKSLPDTFKFKEINIIEFNKEKSVLPQIVQMTTSVDNILSETKNVFDQIADELITSKYDSLEKEQQILKLQRNPTPSLNISFQASMGDSQKMRQLKQEDDQKLYETSLEQKEIELKNQMKMRETIYNYGVEERRPSLFKEATLLDSNRKDENHEPNLMKIPTAEMYSPTATLNSTSCTDEFDSRQLKVKYEFLEKKYHEDINKYNKQIK
jgi:hypothetical protein